ncbi:MAG: 50S ribosomal protein L10 [Bacilli bacterium]
MNQEVLKEKQAVVQEVTDLYKNSKAMVVCEYRGLTVKNVSELRKTLREKDAHAGVFKNSLVSRAVENKDFDAYLGGPNVFLFFKDYTNGSLKSVAKFSRDHEKLVIKGGIVDGKVQDSKYILAIAKLPSREGLLSMLASALQGSIRNFAYVLSEVAGSKK